MFRFNGGKTELRTTYVWFKIIIYDVQTNTGDPISDAHRVYSLICITLLHNGERWAYWYSLDIDPRPIFHLSWPSPCAGPAIIWVIQYFRSCAMSSVSWYFFMSPFMLCLHLCFVYLRSLSPKLPGLAISHRCGWFLASSSGQTTLVFCFLGKFQLVLCAPPSWCLHFWCGPTWSSLLPISTSSFRLNLVCSHLSSLRPNIQNRMSLLVWWSFWRNCLSILRSSSYRTSPRILPSTSSTRLLSYCWTSLTREQWPELFEGCHCRQVSINNRYVWFLYHLWGPASILSLFCWSSAHASQTQLSKRPGLHPLPHESYHTAPGRPRTSSPRVDPSLCFKLERSLL